MCPKVVCVCLLTFVSLFTLQAFLRCQVVLRCLFIFNRKLWKLRSSSEGIHGYTCSWEKLCCQYFLIFTCGNIRFSGEEFSVVEVTILEAKWGERSAALHVGWDHSYLTSGFQQHWRIPLLWHLPGSPKILWYNLCREHSLSHRLWGLGGSLGILSPPKPSWFFSHFLSICRGLWYL